MTAINTSLCYIEKDGCYLMLHRTKKENDYNKDKWIGIGGKFEEGESPEECACREVLEETGLQLNSFEYRGIVTFVSKDEKGTCYELMHLFWSNDFTQKEDKFSECDEGDLQWVKIEKMNDLPHWKGDELFLELIAKKSPFFSLKLIYENGQLIDHKLTICQK